MAHYHFDDAKIGEFVDKFADIYMKTSPDRVNEKKSYVNKLYLIWKACPNLFKDDDD